MNRALLIIFVPALLVALGYVLVLRFMGISPGYPRLFFALAGFIAALWWLSRGKSHTETSGKQS
jgi:uncharacterized membrane protein